MLCTSISHTVHNIPHCTSNSYTMEHKESSLCTVTALQHCYRPSCTVTVPNNPLQSLSPLVSWSTLQERTLLFCLTSQTLCSNALCFPAIVELAWGHHI